MFLEKERSIEGIKCLFLSHITVLLKTRETGKRQTCETEPVAFLKMFKCFLKSLFFLFCRVSHAVGPFLQREPCEESSVPSCCQTAQPHQRRIQTAGGFVPSERGWQAARDGGRWRVQQNHSDQHKERHRWEEVDPTRPSQPLQMEPGSLKSQLPSFSSPKVSLPVT